MLNLKVLCFQKIVNNFQRYNLAYLSTEDENLKLHLEFLRRVYSLKIVKELHKKHTLRREYMDFLINRHLKMIDTRWFEKFSLDPVFEKIHEIGPALKTLLIHGNFDCIEWEKIISHVPNLKAVSYQDYCDDEFIRYIATYCPLIESIDATGSIRVSDQGVRYFCCNKSGKAPFSMLREFLIDSTNVGNDGVKSLIQNLISLENIEFQNLGQVLYSLHECDLVKGINTLNKVTSYSLTRLSLIHLSSTTVYDEILKISISVCHHLKSFACCVREDKQLEMCYMLPELEELYLYCLICDEDGDYFTCKTSIDNFLKLKGRMLISLHLCHFKVSTSIIAQHCPHLYSLHLNNVWGVSFDVVVPLFLNLEKIYLDEICNIEQVISFLSSSPNLKHLFFKECSMEFSDMETQLLKCFEHWKLINVGFISCECVYSELLESILIKCSSLKYLNLAGCKLDFNEDHHLGKVRKLEFISCILPNKPVILYDEKMSVSSDDFNSD